MTDRFNPYKLVVLGAGAVGKSSITLRFVNDVFTPEYLPTIEDCYRKTCNVDDVTAYLDILDTAGQEEYSALRDQWVREGKAFLLVFSVIDAPSLEAIGPIRDRICLVHEERDRLPMLLVGNKIDLEDQREVSPEQAEAVAKSYDIPYVECSALQGYNCVSVFHTAVREIRADEARLLELNKPVERKRRWFCTIL